MPRPLVPSSPQLEKEIKGEEQGEAAGPSIQGQATQEDRTASAAAVVGSQLLEVSPAPAQEVRL